MARYRPLVAEMKYGGATMRPRLGVSGRSKRGTFIKWSILLSVLGLLSFYLYVMFATFRGGDAGSTHPVADAREPQVIDPKKQQLDEAHRTDPILQRKRKIILSTGHGMLSSTISLHPPPLSTKHISALHLHLHLHLQHFITTTV